MYALMASFMTLVVIGLGCFTYIRNRDWRTETTLWQDAMKKAPRMPARYEIWLSSLHGDQNSTPLQYDVALACLIRP